MLKSFFDFCFVQLYCIHTNAIRPKCFSSRRDETFIFPASQIPEIYLNSNQSNRAHIDKIYIDRSVTFQGSQIPEIYLNSNQSNRAHIDKVYIDGSGTFLGSQIPVQKSSHSMQALCSITRPGLK